MVYKNGLDWRTDAIDSNGQLGEPMLINFPRNFITLVSYRHNFSVLGRYS